MKGMNAAESDSMCSREQVLLAKRCAMERFFHIPGAEDDDNGFDRLMTMQSREEIDAATKMGYENGGWGWIYLGEPWKHRELEHIQKSVLKDALLMISVLCRVAPEVALAEIRKYRTRLAPNGDWTHIGAGWDIHYSAVTGCAESQTPSPAI